jgi:hypothetical protein
LKTQFDFKGARPPQERSPSLYLNTKNISSLVSDSNLRVVVNVQEGTGG